MTAEKIIFKANAIVKTVKTNILNLEQKLSSFAFFAVDKISIIFSRILKHKPLKAHRQIPKKRCFEKYCSCDQACEFSSS